MNGSLLLLIFIVILAVTVVSIITGWKLRSLRKEPEFINVIEFIENHTEDDLVFETVGELRKILNNFADDVPVCSGSFKYGNIQIRQGDLYVGSQNWREK